MTALIVLLGTGLTILFGIRFSRPILRLVLAANEIAAKKKVDKSTNEGVILFE